MLKARTGYQYSWDEATDMLDQVAAANLQTWSDHGAPTPPPADAVLGLFDGGAAVPASPAGAFTCEAPPAAAEAAAEAAHPAACGCAACGLPSLDGLPATADGFASGPQQRQGVQGIVIDATVETAVIPGGGAGVSYGDTFKLHSNPGSKFTVYLDFDGHTTTGTSWNSYWGVSSFYSSAFSTDTAESFNASELLRIQQIWQRVAEYFSPFNINVTTEDPGLAALVYSGTGDTNGHGIRVVITDEGGKAYGGIAYVGSFDWNSDTPTYVYANRLADSAKNIADAAAHEIGHTLGLSHDGRATSEYYYGHGSGATDWAPVMGVGYSANIVQWSKGEYSSATTLQDDLTIITTQNTGVAYRADDHGDTFALASDLGGSKAAGVATVAAYGVISGSGARNDVDMFKFALGAGGAIDFTVSGWSRAYVSGSSTPVFTASPFSMLDVALVLYDASFQQVAAFNDIARIDGALKLSGLAAGTYYLALDGVGWGTPSAATPTGYTEYGSLGQYMISGTYSTDDGLGGGGGSATESGSGGETTGGGGGGVTEPGITPTFSVDRATISMLEGGSDSFVIRATGVTGDIAVDITGTPAGKASLSASQVFLTAANNWTATVGVISQADRDVGTDVAYALQLATEALGTLSVGVTSKENDLSAKSGGIVVGSYTTKPGLNVNTVANQAKDDAKATVVREGMLSSGEAGIELRWEFTKLTAGNKLVQVDAWSTVEQFRLEYSVDNAATWLGFAGAPSSSLKWQGDFVASGVSSNLWVRLVDTVRSGDVVRDTISIDLLTLGTPPDLLF
jgi:hypothetical protein